MKKTTTFLISIIFCLVLACAVSANLPMVVSGKVGFKDELYKDQPIKITCDRLGHSWTVKTTDDGIYLVTLNNLQTNSEAKIIEGDKIRLSVCPAEVNPGCERIVYASTDPQWVNWDISSDVLYEPQPDPKPEPVDPIEPDDDEECEVCPQCDTTVCPDIPVCPDWTCDCPVVSEEEKTEGLIYVISALLLGLAGGGVGGYFVKRKEALGKGVGIKIYTKRDGSEGVYHKHPGIVGYHSLLITHRAVKVRHDKGELTPYYEKNEDGEWEYFG